MKANKWQLSVVSLVNNQNSNKNSASNKLLPLRWFLNNLHTVTKHRASSTLREYSVINHFISYLNLAPSVALSAQRLSPNCWKNWSIQLRLQLRRSAVNWKEFLSSLALIEWIERISIGSCSCASLCSTKAEKKPSFFSDETKIAWTAEVCHRRRHKRINLSRAQWVLRWWNWKWRRSTEASRAIIVRCLIQISYLIAVLVVAFNCLTSFAVCGSNFPPISPSSCLGIGRWFMTRHSWFMVIAFVSHKASFEWREFTALV
jgi:hypothetical protein